MNLRPRVRLVFCRGCGEMLGVEDHIRIRSEHLNLTDHCGLRFEEYVSVAEVERAVDKDCPRCHGSGEIGWNDSPINDPQCAQEATCNVCHGEGVV